MQVTWSPEHWTPKRPDLPSAREIAFRAKIIDAFVSWPRRFARQLTDGVALAGWPRCAGALAVGCDPLRIAPYKDMEGSLYAPVWHPPAAPRQCAGWPRGIARHDNPAATFNSVFVAWSGVRSGHKRQRCGSSQSLTHPPRHCEGAPDFRVLRLDPNGTRCG